MRKILVLWAALSVTLNPTGISPLNAAAAAVVQNDILEQEVTEQVPFRISFSTDRPNPVRLEIERTDFDDEIGKPLRKAKAKRIEEAQRAEAARLAALVAARQPVVIDTGDAWAALRFCESGGDYTTNTGNGYYGAYQFDIGTWGNYGGYPRADLAPPAVQDARARQTQAERGWQPWPACARKLGLL